MKTLLSLVAIALAASSCGDSNKNPADARIVDTANPDATPAAPTLGPQIDRLGRPAVNTVMNHGFDGNTTTAGAAKDTYNQDSAQGTWPTSYAPAFAVSLGMVDVLDSGLTCADGTCTPEAGGGSPGDGCGNQAFYKGPTGPTSYLRLAGVMADDELYLDTTKTMADLPSHQNYLAVEINVITQGAVNNVTCGGRAPTNDVIDTSYSALSVGLNGFKASDGSFKPAIGDGVDPHTDVSNDTFPFLGAPH